MDENYEVKGSVYKLEQRKVQTIGLDHLPNHDSFDVEFSTSGQVLQITTYNMAGAVLGSTRFTYDDSGQTASSVEFDGIGRRTRGSLFIHRTEQNRKTITVETDGNFAGRTVEVYERALLLSFASYDEENRLKREKIFHYSGINPRTSDSRYYLPDGRLAEQWLSSYDAEGRIIETYGLKADGRPLGDGKYKYEYDAEGRRSRVWSFNDLVDEVANALRLYEYSCDEHGNWIERREFHQFRGDSHWSNKTTTRKLTYYL